jgi:uncharacterized membrane protein
MLKPYSIIWQSIFFALTISGFLFLKGLLLKWSFQKYSGRISALFILFFLFLFWVIICSWLSVIQYNGFFSGHNDLAGFDQAIWNTLQGRPLHTTIYNHNFLGEHMSPILIILAPFYLIWQDPRMLLILQSLFLGITAIPIYLIAKDKLKHNLLSLSFSFAYLFHPFLSRINLFEFHEIALAPFFLAFTFYFLQRKSWFFYFLFLFLSLMVKEDVSLIIIGLSIYTFFKVNRRVGIVTFLMGISWAYLSVKVFIPYIRVVTGSGTSEEIYGYFGRYTLGSSPEEIIKNIITKPQQILKMLFLPCNEKSATLFLLFLPSGLLSILSPTILLTFPEILLHFLAPWSAQHLLFFQYSAPIIPFAIISGIYGSSFLLNKRPDLAKNLSLGFTLCIISLSIFSNYYFSHETLYATQELYLSKSLLSFPKREKIKTYYQKEFVSGRRLFECLKKIVPKDVSISLQDNLMAHFSERLNPLYLFPDFKDAEYVIFNSYGLRGVWTALWSTTQEGYNEGLSALFQDERFQIFVRDDLNGGNILLFGRKEKSQEIIKKAEDLVESDPSPETHFILASIYFHTDNLKEAKKEIEVVLRLDPENIEAGQMLSAINQKFW